MSKTLLLRQSFTISQRLLFSTTSINLDNELHATKPFSEVPSLSATKLIMRSMPGGIYYKRSLKELHESMRAEFGNILRFPALFGTPGFIFVYQATDFEKTFRAEGNWPERVVLDSLAYYRKSKRPDIYQEYPGLFTAQGEEWQKMRTLTNPILMQPKTVKLYCQQVDEIAKEFVEIMKKLRDEKSEMPADFSNYMNSWSLESITAIALETRLNILSGSSENEKAQALIKNIRLFFEKAFEFDALPSIWRYYKTKGFKEFLKVYDTITDFILHYIEAAIKEMETKKDSGDDHEDSILRKLVKLNKKAAVVMASDMLLAGVDTTATATIYTLYCIAKNPDKQQKLRDEIMKILPDKTTELTGERMKNMPYLRAVMKESQRLFPVVAGTGRMTKKNVVLAGYQVPPGHHVIMPSQFELVNSNQYSEPNQFIPERWLRDNVDPQCPHAKRDAHPFAFLPFGFGSRMCIGRRLAELEMEVLLANIIRNFNIEWNHPDMKMKSTFINVPVSDLKFKITDI